MKAVFLRELKSYFITPLGYVYLAIFWIVSAGAFTILVVTGQGELTYIYSILSSAVMVLTPLLTMRIFSEERRQKTEQLYLTAPVSLTSIVLGKYLAALAVYAAGILSTLVFAVVLTFYSAVSWPLVVGNLIGMLFLGSTCISVSSFISSLTESQILSAIGSIVIMCVLLFLSPFSVLVPWHPLRAVLRQLSFSTHYYSLTIGVLNVRDLFFFCSLTFLFLFLTIRGMEARRWRN